MPNCVNGLIMIKGLTFFLNCSSEMFAEGVKRKEVILFPGRVRLKYHWLF